VNKEERDNKGASLTTNISLAGRYLVLMPGTDLHGVSRKIEDEKERKKLREIVKALRLPDNMGFIIRTAGLGRTKTALSLDLNYVLKLWQSIEKNVADVPAPALLYREQDIVIRSIRDHFSSDIAEILVDHKAVYNRVRNFFHQLMPKHENLVKLYQEKRPLFNKYQLEEQVERVYRKRINLKSGGYIIIEPTEAMVTVDVNSGSATKEKGIEETAFRVNMEAAPEIVRQLRLRDLGGIIVIDFIDMFNKKHKLDVERAVKAELKKDRAKCKVLRISSLGLLELSRQRLKSSLGTGEYLQCPLCEGRGQIRSPDVTALSVFRRIKSLAIKPDVAEVRATVPAKVAEYLLNNVRGPIVQTENQYNARIVVLSREHLPENEISVEPVKKEELDQAVPVGAALPVVDFEHFLETEEEPGPEQEKKRQRKPSRRRRRSRKKSPAESPDEAEEVSAVRQDGAAEAPTEQPGADSSAMERPDSQAEPEGKSLAAARQTEEEEPKQRRSWLRFYLPFS
jgi:ribonuclease E